MSRRASRRQSATALALIAPLAIGLLLNFVAPIALLLTRAWEDRELPGAWPHTAAALRTWSGAGLPDEKIAAVLVEEIRSSYVAGTLSRVANRLNYDRPGSRSLLFDTARQLTHLGPVPADTSLDLLRHIDPRWGDASTWATVRHAAGPTSSFYLLAAVDRRLDAQDNIVGVPAAQAVFLRVFGRTFVISGVVTLICAVLGYPVAYTLATLPQRLASVLLIVLLLPFWTSVLVRSTAWMVLLQDQGIVNQLLIRVGLTAKPLQLIYNRTGVFIAMTHVLLPYFVLPLYSVMRAIPAASLRAAHSLGAHPGYAFWRVYLPQTMPGVTAGGLIVFILALGYYITPALLGGAGDQMIGYFIAYYTNEALNWGMAAALSLILLTVTLGLVSIYGRIAGMQELALR
jgi:putative spermidine/putrescine transport system permease protein